MLYDSNSEALKAFACGHIFHLCCLKKHYLEQFSENRNEVEKMFKSSIEKLRCVNCNLKGLEVGEDDSKSQVKKAGFQAAQQQSSVKKDPLGKGKIAQDDEDVDELDESERYAARMARVQEKRSQTIMNK